MRATPTAEPLTWQLPREHRVPEHVRSWGDDAVQMAWEAGIACLPWQELVLRDMLTERADGLWAAREAGVTVGRQNGKSVLAIVRVLAGLYVLEEELIVYTAHQLRTAEEIFSRLVFKVERTPDLRRRHVKTIQRAGEKGIVLREPDQRLTVAARSKESIRGFSADVIILDEAQMGLDEDDMSALGPTQRTRPNPQTIIMGTPPLAKGTWWGRFRRRALAGDPDVSWHGWTPRPRSEDESEEQWRNDREIWAQTHPALGVLVTERAIAHDLKTLGEQFDRECLCLYPVESEDAGWEIFTERDWRTAGDADSEIAGPFAFGIEASYDLAWLSVGAAGRRVDGKRHLEPVARFHADTGRMVGWLKKRLGDEEKKPAVVAIDPAGPAAYLIPEIERHCGIEVFKPLGRDLAAACGSVYVGISGQPDARDVKVRTSTPDLSEPLTDAAKAVVWRDRGDAKVFDRRVEDSADVSPLLAVTLADLAVSRLPEPDQPFFAFWR